jgi:5-methyltetrahydrofolate--homocysteine methyltransferase
MGEDLVATIAALKEAESIALVKRMLGKGENPQGILDACSAAMSIVGAEYEKGNFFLAELLMSGEILRQISDLVKPEMAEVSGDSLTALGKIVIGTVKNDIHDIGKNIFTFMLEVNGFEVHDLGVDVPVDAFVEKVREVDPDIVALSGFLTVVFDQMKETVEGLKKANLRDGFKVMIGGCQMDENIVMHVGADGYRPDAVSGVRLAKEWVGGA